MWRGTQNMVHSLLNEILLRIVLLAAVCIMQLSVRPHVQYITEAAFLNEYKRPRHESYIPAWAMIILVIFVPLLFMSAPLLYTKDYAGFANALLAWTLALAINAIVTETMKGMIGRPRPDFFYRCFPNGKMTPGLHCMGNEKDVIEGRKSFPSGHSSFSFSSLGFLSVWLCGKMGMLSRNRGEGWRVIVCLLPLSMSCLVAISRCCDNHHHWEDVLVGSVLGFTISYLCYHQYYNALDSYLSGQPYVIVSENELFPAMSQMQCCTKDLNNELGLILRFCNKNALESNKKIC